MTIDYEYDFGSTTALMITVVNYRIGYWAKEKVTILSRNNPYVFLCSQCGEKPAESAWNVPGKGRRRACCARIAARPMHVGKIC